MNTWSTPSTQTDYPVECRPESLVTLAVLVVATLITAQGLADGGFRYPDEAATPSVRGILILDMIRDGVGLDRIQRSTETILL
ncbi:MAG: hypothetical protein U1D30_11605 [Planctomycetota bacterium]